LFFGVALGFLCRWIVRVEEERRRRAVTIESSMRVPPWSDVLLCGRMRISAFSVVNSHFNAENAEIRRGPQRQALRETTEN